jgi:hypothetical protein
MDFVANMAGTLIRLEEDEGSRFRFEIWFDYTKQAMNLIREGAMLAVPNFASNNHEQHLSILEVVSILPMHYALGDDTRGYPGFVVEAAKSVVNDWEEQEVESTEDTTKIRCIAIPTNLEVVQSTRAINNAPDLQEEANLPMVGANCRLLDTEFTEYVVNYGIAPTENTLEIGNLIRDSKVNIKVRIEDLLRTHFGIFGFTGAGKSNLLSTLVSKVLTESDETVKVVFFDLMGEYTTLLIDQLLREDIDAHLVCLGEHTLPLPVLKYINKEGDSTLQASRSFLRYTLLPKALKPHSGDMQRALQKLMESERVKVFREVENWTLYDLFFDKNNDRSPVKTKARQAANFTKRNELLKEFVKKHGGTNRRVDKASLAETILNDLQNEITSKKGLYEFGEDLQGVIKQLEEAIPKLENPLRCSISLEELAQLLNSKDRPGLFVFNSHDPNNLRTFARTIGEYMYDSRRKSGEIEPLVSFVFDEADEFIPQQTSGSYEHSSEIAQTLARRGRKFGLGIGIATQRVRYLNTSIMAQPHTYFVSKMPRSSDRQVVAEAFGVSDDLFRQTFKFKKGDWLLMSYDATGLEAIPIPIHCEDANERIKQFLTRSTSEVTVDGR